MDITVIIPVHKADDETKNYYCSAVNSVIANKETFNGMLKIITVCPNNIAHTIKNYGTSLDGVEITIIENDGNTDFCTQINEAVKVVDTDYFSIMEYDDAYSSKWFKMVSDYLYTNEDVSVFLPINVLCNPEMTMWQFGNEMIWASSFSNEIGYIDFECLDNCYTFNLTGGVFNTNDFKAVGGFKPSIKVAFNYELLLRMTNKGLKVFVVPKEGYRHTIGRSGSLTEEYMKEFSTEDIQKWFDLAKREYLYTEDRNKTILNRNTEILK